MLNIISIFYSFIIFRIRGLHKLKLISFPADSGGSEFIFCYFLKQTQAGLALILSGLCQANIFVKIIVILYNGILNNLFQFKLFWAGRGMKKGGVCTFLQTAIFFIPVIKKCNICVV